jgi:putative transposase
VQCQRAGHPPRWKGKPSRKGSGFEQPPHAHQHWHIDISYINVSGTFYYLCSILDGYSRAIVHWDSRESMTEAESEVIGRTCPWNAAAPFSKNSFCQR